MFRTEITPPPSEEKISLSSPVLSIGSCFSDCMGQRMVLNKFDAVANPYGTVYNPISIFQLLDYTRQKKYPPPDSYVETQGLHANYNFHSTFSAAQLDDVHNSIHHAIDHASEYLKQCEWIIITLGTAFVYRRKDNKGIVANCHKVPTSHFTKELLSPKQITEAFEASYKSLQAYRPDIKIILTVSPVRHIKDTLEQNSVSKATLRLVCDQLERDYTGVQYFPSYEIMMDDLRDYRFYKPDMIHPTESAEEYIWNKFGDVYFNEDTQKFLEEWRKILQAMAHHPFNPSSDGHQKFLRQTIDRLRRLEKKVKVTDEILSLEKQLTAR